MDMKTLVVAACVAVLRTSALSDLSDIPGRFCEARRVPCCSNRQDNCSVPILGTLCYCDQFCDRPHNDDCCPDYQYVCLRVPRPTAPPTPIGTCYYKNRYYNVGSGVKINCNECQCQEVCSGTECRPEMKCSQNPCLVDPTDITNVNRDRFAGWKATNYSQFWGRTLDEGLKRRLGTRHSLKKVRTMRPVDPNFDRERVRARLWYDPRQEKPGMISPPLDQGWCAADWVISTVQIATDRLALVSKGVDRTFLSPQHLLSCNSKNQGGCDGGHLTRAWKFIQKFGLVPEECYRWTGRQTNCSVSKLRDRRVTSTRCADGNSVMPLHRTGPAYRVASEPEAIMHEIMTSGPVQATMRVRPSFFSYRSGVYQCQGSFPAGEKNYHAVRIIGWGEEMQGSRLVKYWIVSNSWGTWWGENGYFRIARGVNACEIESLVLASWVNPIVPKKDPSMPTMDSMNSVSNSL